MRLGTAARVYCPGGRRMASSSATPAPAGSRAPPPLVIYRGPPAMKPGFNLLCGAIFIGTGLNVAYIASSHLSWPIFSRDLEKNPPKLLPLGLRLATAVGIALLGVGSSYFFFLVPMRTITRMTIKPAQHTLTINKAQKLAVQPPSAAAIGAPMVHIRTTIPSFNQFIPSVFIPSNLLYGMRINGWHHPDAATKRDRVVPVESVFRFTGKATDGMSSLQAAQRGVSLAGSIGQPERKSVLLRVGRSKIAYTMESEGILKPASASPNGQAYSIYRTTWAWIKYSLRGKRDDADHTPAEAEGKTGPLSTPGLGEKEPWFLNRSKFDQLFPFERRAMQK
ncbi:hypothetical protein OC845_002055 [Tilletia horrida]|nr:hypothetical protein OC845_002055 [Tilletia horrida]